MIGEIFCIVLGFVGLYLSIIEYKEEGVSDFCAVMFFIFLICGIIVFFNFYDGTRVYTTPIVSLDLGSEIHGKFTLGFGSVDSELVYYAYEELGSGQYRLYAMSGNTIIQETNQESPKYVSESICWEDGPFYDCEWQARTKIIVPIGTIKKEFRVN